MIDTIRLDWPKLKVCTQARLWERCGMQIGGPEHELLRLLRLAEFPDPVDVEPVSCTSSGGRDVPWHEFLRRRERGEGKPAANGAGYRLMHPLPGRGAGAGGGGVREPLWDGRI